MAIEKPIVPEPLHELDEFWLVDTGLLEVRHRDHLMILEIDIEVGRPEALS
jgi:hypothetical protein